MIKTLHTTYVAAELLIQCVTITALLCHTLHLKCV